MVGPFREKTKKSHKPKGSHYSGGVANRHQQKTDDIKRALVHRARIKKKYYQMLESEGLSKNAKDDAAPSVEDNRYEDEENEEVVPMPGAEDYSESENEFEGEEAEVEADLDMADSEDEEVEELVEELVVDKNTKLDTSNKKPSSSSKPESGPRLSYAERAKLVKQRKKDQREQKEKEYQIRQKEKAKKLEAKEKVKKQFTKRTPRGQPLMGVRINNLLDKIQKDNY